MSRSTMVDTNVDARPSMSYEDLRSVSHADTIEEIRVPEELLSRYVEVALRRALPRELEPGRWYVDIDGFPGVWADGDSPRSSLETLAEVLREWLILKIIDKDRDIPIIEDIDLSTLINR